MIWPRVIGIAESGWLPKDKKNLKGFMERLRRYVELLEERGYHPYKLDMGDRQESQAPIDHLARGKKVTYNSPISPYYPAHNEAEMTNGLRGNWDFHDGVWQGFHHDDSHNYTFDVTVDLEESKEFHQVYVTWLRNHDQMIYTPQVVKISVSYDGVSWATIYEETYPWDDTAYAYLAKGFQGNASGRYIRYQAYIWKDYPHYMFADELVVL
ncbi:F5/8 type C domain containing protein [Trichomonas vaginalis G3]|uniref:F5/8 type C domain containing protein n=1 Tax=Trichomonas vaginalis (strain ATCC PRA-98 / G3) TaxID=412133 RepID=A2EGP0_TRIV3|nr:glycosyl hydrolase family 20, catalytic domain-containing protein [Trichomonas vaginalis G3]EAY08128.1 F5/8 type C domain containing protein [Trichomonas vaginalis G3]KAI5548741.1 glycosyl hydrolase family 20, catalytic domain-containing protein [Trichomonas vaginalis G3]|eukprot:XP_001320351.1 F5/8 type C domain containing protein [Trichomonas vaginalis G3]